MLALSPIPAAPAYHRHRPEQTILCAIVAAHYPSFVREIEQSGGYLRRFVRQEFVLTFPFPCAFWRFGSALALKPHRHMLLLDGAYQFHGNRITLHRAGAPSADLAVTCRMVQRP